MRRKIDKTLKEVRAWKRRVAAKTRHMTREQVGDILSHALGREVSRENVAEQVAVIRVEHRKSFLNAGMGISGANALIAESGTVMMVTNEGNGRLVTSLPRDATRRILSPWTKPASCSTS